MSNYYMSRLMRGGLGYIDEISGFSNPSMKMASVYNGQLYYITHASKNNTTSAKVIYLYCWDGKKDSPTLVNTYTLDMIIAGGGNEKPFLLTYNDELYLVGANSSSQYMYKLLPTYTIIKSSSVSGPSFTQNSNISSYKYVVYNNKIHVFGTVSNSTLSNTKTSSALSAYAGFHYSYDGTSWSKASTSTICFRDECIPVVWNNKIYIVTWNYYYSSNNVYVPNGATIHFWNGTNWSVFYSKIRVYNSDPQVDSTNTSTSAHAIYFQNKDGTYDYAGSFPHPVFANLGGAVAHNNELYLFSNSLLIKYNESLGEFVATDDVYPQEDDVYVPGGSAVYERDSYYQSATVVSYKNKIYGLGGFCATGTNGDTLTYNSHVYGFNPTTEQWDHPLAG